MLLPAADRLRLPSLSARLRLSLHLKKSEGIGMHATDYGVIRKVSEFAFVWEVPDFAYIVGKDAAVFNLESPHFECEDESWFLFVQQTSNSSETSFGLFFNSPEDDGSNPRTHSFELFIKGDERTIYWTSSVVTHTFRNDEHTDYLVTVPKSDIKRDSNRIAPSGVLFLYITFFPGKEPSRKGIYKLLQHSKNLLLNEEDCDVTLIVKGRKFRAHKIIIMARSPVLAAKFRKQTLDGEKDGVMDIKIQDCDPDAFHRFLLYLYSGRIEKLDVNSVVKLHYIGRKYDVQDLTEACVKSMIGNMTVDSFFEFITVGLRHSETALMESASRFFAKNLKKILANHKWRKFFEENSAEAHELLNTALDHNPTTAYGPTALKEFIIDRGL